MAQLLSSIQPPPFRVPLLDDQGQLVETWARFFLSAQAAIVQILAAKPAAFFGTVTMPLDDPSGFIDDFAGLGRATSIDLLDPNIALLNRTNQGWSGKNNYTSPLNQPSITILGNPTAGQSFGLYVQAGTTNADYALQVRTQTLSSAPISVFGTGGIALGGSGALSNDPGINNVRIAGGLNVLGLLTLSGTITGAGGVPVEPMLLSGLMRAGASNDNLYGVFVQSTFATAGWANITAYGIRVADITGVTTHYALYTGLGLIRFGDDVSTTGKLAVTGTSALTGDVTVTGNTIFNGQAASFGLASAANGGLKLLACNAGPLFGAGFGGIAYRNTGEVWADPAFIFRGNGYAFEDSASAWMMIVTPNKRAAIGINSTDASALPLDTVHLRGTGAVAIRLDNDTTAADFVRISYLSPTLSISKAISVTGTITTSGNLNLPNTGLVNWAGLGQFSSPSDGQYNFVTNATTVGCGINVATDAVWKLRTRAQTGDATLWAGLINLPNTGGAATSGTLTLVAGVQTVNTTAATATALIFFQRVTAGGTIGFATTYTKVAGTSFTVSSDNILDTSTYNWWIVEVH